ncbi:MAG: hypothetical protein HY304_06385 [candidate division Zixibacteria bacterium]|nr:hypothetical protein [candidate division Zixibacteria bacterium]
MALMIVAPLFAALFFNSFVVKAICWAVSLLAYVNFLRLLGPCVMAVAVGILPLYVFFEWNSAPNWLAYIAGAISLLEASYIRQRMRFIATIREKEGILL